MLFHKRNRPLIGVADSGCDGFALVRVLQERYPWADIVYANDPLSLPFEGRKPEEITAILSHVLDTVLENYPCAIVVASDLLAEHGEAVFQRSPVPVIWTTRLADELLRTKYEQKNILLLARSETLAANLYQKGLKYNHLYTIPSDPLEALVRTTRVKTEESFLACQKILLPVRGKDVDVVIAPSPSLASLSIEIGEFVKTSGGFAAEFPDITLLTAEALARNVSVERGKGSVRVCTSLKEEAFKKETSLLGNYKAFGPGEASHE